MKFRVGDKVAISGVDTPGDCVDNYSVNIPAKYLRHGSTIPDDSYFKDFATIKAIYGDLYCVEYLSYAKLMVCLGFKEKYLRLIRTAKISNWRKELMRTKK